MDECPDKRLDELIRKLFVNISHPFGNRGLHRGGWNRPIAEIGNTIGSISKIATAIFEAVDQQNAATTEVARNIQMAATGSSEVAASIVRVNKGAEETGLAAAEVHTSAGSLTSENQQLRAGVDQFLATLRSA